MTRSFFADEGQVSAAGLKNGEILWQYRDQNNPNFFPRGVATSDGKVFVTPWSGKFVALDQKTGATVWEFSYQGEGTDSWPVVADNKACLGAHEGYFYYLDTETGKSV